MASVMAKSVSVLMLKPNAAMTVKVPIKETGIAAAGMSVARQLCRNAQVMRITSRRAERMVTTISSMVV